MADELGFSSHMHALLQDRLHVVDSHSDGESVEDMEALQGLVNWCSSCATINKQAVAADINSLNEVGQAAAFLLIVKLILRL